MNDFSFRQLTMWPTQNEHLVKVCMMQLCLRIILRYIRTGYFTFFRCSNRFSNWFVVEWRHGWINWIIHVQFCTAIWGLNKRDWQLKDGFYDFFKSGSGMCFQMGGNASCMTVYLWQSYQIHWIWNCYYVHTNHKFFLVINVHFRILFIGLLFE